MNLEPRLQRRYETLVMAHSNSTSPLAPGIKALANGVQGFAHTQALWRFLHHEDVTPPVLSQPLLAACHAALAQAQGDYALCVHDWSRINYGRHHSKADRLQMSHATDLGYELQSSLLVDAQSGQPLSLAAQNLVSAEGSWQSRHATLQPATQTHLDELSERITWIEQQGLTKRLVHVVDREADSAGHWRHWSKHGYAWLVRVKAQSRVCWEQQEMVVAQVAQQLTWQPVRQVSCQGQACTQWVGSTQIEVTRHAKPKRVNENGQRVTPVAGAVLSLRLVVSRLVNAEDDVVAQWYLLSNVGDEVEPATLALWYYWRWEIESFFKLLKSAGHQLESWEQQTARATFNRLLIATQACVLAWALLRAPGEEAKETRAFLVRLSGRQMKRSKPVTAPALLAGLFTLLTMLEALEDYSVEELQAFAQFAKQQLFLGQGTGFV